jgi:toxin ParE1/3/4
VKLRFTSHATRQLDHIAEYINEENPAGALRVGDRVRETVRSLTRFPSLGRPGSQAGTSEIIVPGLPYIVVYRLAGDTVEILGIYHTAQLRPGQSRPTGDS